MYVRKRTFLKGIGATAATVGGLSGVVGAQPPQHTVFDLDFSDPADASTVGANSPGWQVDRRDVDTWEAASFDGDDRLCINIDESGPVTGFDDYQGKKYLPETGGHWDTGHNSVLSYRFYIDPAWEADSDTDGDPDTDDGQQTGMWGVVADANENIIAYPILEYQDSDAVDSPLEDENTNANPEPDGANFRVFLQNGAWYNLGIPRQTRVDPAEGGWVDVSARFIFDDDDPKVLWSVNNAVVAIDDTIGLNGDPALFREPILNSQNFGYDVTYYYDDIKLIER